jgi:hypothetical protein
LIGATGLVELITAAVRDVGGMPPLAADTDALIKRRMLRMTVLDMPFVAWPGTTPTAEVTKPVILRAAINASHSLKLRKPATTHGSILGTPLADLAELRRGARRPLR